MFKRIDYITFFVTNSNKVNFNTTKEAERANCLGILINKQLKLSKIKTFMHKILLKFLCKIPPKLLEVVLPKKLASLYSFQYFFNRLFLVLLDLQ